MFDVTLALAVLLSAGFLTAKLGQIIRLPSVTGYILTGFILGPAGLNFITEETFGGRLEHFTQIALMLIAFGIGEHLELKRLKPVAKSICLIGICETSGAFLLVGFGTFLLAGLTKIGGQQWQVIDYLIFSLLLGVVATATAPAATLHVMRELKAAGPLTSTLMAVVAFDNGLAIMFFGVSVSLVHHIAGDGAGSIIGAVGSSLMESLLSLLMGIATGFLIDFIVNRLKKKEEMLTAGLALLLLCGELARLLNLSPLLAGMATGFTIVNRDHRDVRVFRAINAFEPPIYVMFFALAGAHLDLSSMAMAGWIGLAYFILREAGKILGANVGARLASSPKAVQNFLGLALMPQAGVAIGLVFLIQENSSLSVCSSIITSVVLTGVIMSELAGPFFTRLAVTKACETASARKNSDFEKVLAGGAYEAGPAIEKFQLMPWIWERLEPPENPDGVVIFGAAYSATSLGLARMAAIIAHHYGALPMAVHILNGANGRERLESRNTINGFFDLSENEVRKIGSKLQTETVYTDNVAKGIIKVVKEQNTRGILLGHPIKGTAQEFQRVIEAVAAEAPCQVIVARFAGIVHTERILVPITDDAELSTVGNVVRALGSVGNHRITLFRLAQPGSTEDELNISLYSLKAWAEKENLSPPVEFRVERSEARLGTILHEAAEHDLLVMAATQLKGLSRLFVGSLAEDVVQHSKKTMLIVHGPNKKN